MVGKMKSSIRHVKAFIMLKSGADFAKRMFTLLKNLLTDLRRGLGGG